MPLARFGTANAARHGVGLLGCGAKDTLSCTASRKGAKKPGLIAVTFRGDGQYDWAAAGTVAYFKIHLAEKRTWVCTRLQLNRKNPLVWVPLPPEQVAQLAPGRPVNTSGAWTSVALDAASQVTELGELLRVAYGAVRNAKAGGAEAD